MLLDGRAAASCILAAAAEGREIRTIEGLSRDGPTPLQEAFVAEDALQCGLHAGPDRHGDGAARAHAESDPGGDPGRHGRQPAAAARTRRSSARSSARRGGVMARLVRSTRDGGRVEEVWALVDEEDDLETWPAGAELAVVGGEAPRLDGPRRRSGGVHVDVRLPGMLHAAVLRAPVAHARVTGLDVGAALRRARRAGGADAHVEGLVQRCVSSGRGGPLRRAAARGRRGGHAGARGCRLTALAAAIEAQPHVVDLDTALQEQRFTRDPYESARGDVDDALAGADATVELEIETPDHLQTPLEPHAAVAVWHGDELTAWVSTQGMFWARDELAERFGLRHDQVRVISAFIGGGFGSKQGAGVEALLAAELARQTGRPVRVVNDRHEEQLDGGRRAWTRQSVRLGGSRDGRLVAVDADALVAQGLGGWVPSVLAPAMTLYRSDHARAQTFRCASTGGRRTPSERPASSRESPCWSRRSTSSRERSTSTRSSCAAAITSTPISERVAVPSNHILACYDRAAELAGWADREASRAADDGLLRGMGCASQIWWVAGRPRTRPCVSTRRARARRDRDPGHRHRHADDRKAGRCGGARFAGRARPRRRRRHRPERLRADCRWLDDDLRDAGRPLGRRQQHALQLASDALEIAPGDLFVREGRIRLVDGAIDVPVAEITEKPGDATIDGRARGPNPAGFEVHTFGCQIAQVVVDPAVGEIRVERVVAVHDVGRIVNRLGAASQVEGGVLGMAFALMEELVVDPTTGVPVNATLDDYKLPTIADTPEIVVDFVDVPDENLPNIGAKGSASRSIIPTAAAIANAFAHATGRRCGALPMTRARVLEALR